jgi:hypothetical protein
MGQKHYAAMPIVGVMAAGLGGIIGIDSLLHAAGSCCCGTVAYLTDSCT